MRAVSLACLLFLLAILWANPNYQWSSDRTSPYAADFVQEWVAGDMLLSGQVGRIYHRPDFQAWQHDAHRLGFSWPESQYYPAVYPPPYYCLTAPLALLPYRLAAVVWLGLLVLAYVAAALLAMRTWPAAIARHNKLFWSLGLLMPAMFFGCVLGQKGSLWLLVLASSVYLLQGNRPWAAGCVAALLTLKPTLCGFIPLAMLLCGHWRFCGGFVLGAGLLYGSCAWWMPTALWQEYLQVVTSAADYQAQAGYRSGWSTSAMTLLNGLGLTQGLSLAILAVSGAALIASVVARSRRFGSGDLSAGSRGNPLLDPTSLWQLLVGTALLSPHSYFYDLTWLLLPLSGWFAKQPRSAMVCLATVWIGMVLGQSYEYGPAIPALALIASLLYSMRPAAVPGTTDPTGTDTTQASGSPADRAQLLPLTGAAARDALT